MVLTAAAATALAGGLTAAGSVGSGMLGMMAANHGAYKQYKYNSQLQKQAAKLNYNYGIKSLENSPSAQRLGLESAGYNPMLAVQNATSGANAGWTSNSSVSQPDYSGAVSSFAGAYQNLRHLANETRSTDSQVEANEATAQNQRAQAQAQQLKNPYIQNQIKAELGKLDAETSKIQRETTYFDELVNLRQKELELQEMGIYVGADTARYSADQSYNATKYAANKNKEIADEHSPSGQSLSFGQYANGISNILRAGSSFLPWNSVSNQVNFDSLGNVTSTSRKRTKKHR